MSGIIPSACGERSREGRGITVPTSINADATAAPAIEGIQSNHGADFRSSAAAASVGQPSRGEPQCPSRRLDVYFRVLVPFGRSTLRRYEQARWDQTAVSQRP